MHRIWLAEGRPRDMLFESYRNYKRAKRHFRVALNNEFNNYMKSVYHDLDNAAECDIRLFWKLVKRRKNRTSRTYPEIQGKIPYSWKKGFIVPLFKGADKPKTCNSYRSVALLSCFLKIFESFLNNRIKHHIIDFSLFPCTQQQGFQENLGCLTASFNLHETVYHNLEQGNSVYVSFLDNTKIFDTVWRHGLLVKLFNMGIKGQLWSILHDCSIYSCKSNTV